MSSIQKSELYVSVVCLFYYIVTYSDGKASDVELSLKSKIAEIEKFDENEFEHQFLIYRQIDKTAVFNRCIAHLKDLESSEQIRILAWMFVVSDSDADFNEKEWNIIQHALNILDLPLIEILFAERNLNALLARDINLCSRSSL